MLLWSTNPPPPLLLEVRELLIGQRLLFDGVIPNPPPPPGYGTATIAVLVFLMFCVPICQKKKSVTVVECDEASILEVVKNMNTEDGDATTVKDSGGGAGPETDAQQSSSAEGLFDVILLGGGDEVGGARGLDAAVEPGRIKKAGLTPAERLDLVLDRYIGI